MSSLNWAVGKGGGKSRGDGVELQQVMRSMESQAQGRRCIRCLLHRDRNGGYGRKGKEEKIGS